MLKFDSLKKVTAVDSLENLHGTAKLFKDTTEVGTGTFRTSNVGGNVMVDASVVTKEEIVSPAALPKTLKLKLVETCSRTITLNGAGGVVVPNVITPSDTDKPVVDKENSDPDAASKVSPSEITISAGVVTVTPSSSATGKLTLICHSVVAESVATDPDAKGDVKVTAKANAISKSAHISVYTCLEEMSEYHRPESVTTVTDADVTRSIA